MWTPQMTPADCERSWHDMAVLQWRYALGDARRCGECGFDAVARRTELQAWLAGLEPQQAAARIASLAALRSEVGDWAFPEAATALLLPDVRRGMAEKRDAAEASFKASFAGFTYEFCPEYFGPDRPDYLTLHFRNAFGPQSPLDHRSELRTRLLDLLAVAREQRPEVGRVQCASWINHLPDFVALFPATWQRHGRECPYEPHAGWWGQFINRKGQLNTPAAERLLAVGSFQYTNRHCQCGVDELVRHLDVTPF